MNTLFRAVPVVIVLGSSMMAAAGEHCDGERPCKARMCCSNPLLTGCPDDYCRKPMPRVPCLPCGETDDYCRKVPPRIRRLSCGECDDYCRKPWPHVCRPLRPEYYNCGRGPS